MADTEPSPRRWSDLTALEKWSLLPMALSALAGIWALDGAVRPLSSIARKELAAAAAVSAFVLGALFTALHVLFRKSLKAGTFRLFATNLVGALFVTAFALPFNLMLLGAVGPLHSETRVMGVLVQAPLLDAVGRGAFWLLIYLLDVLGVAAWYGAAAAFVKLLYVPAQPP